MDKLRLGKTNLMVSKSGFGALPIQRASLEEAKRILRKSYDNGINFFDTARLYTDSEEKIGCSLTDVRKDILIATKTMATDKKALLADLETSLKNLKTDYVDIFQLHDPAKLPDPEDPEGLYSGLKEAQEKGMVRFIGITSHKIKNALGAMSSGLYDTVQFPLNSLSTDAELKIIEEGKNRDIGVIAMKGLSGGLITNAASTFAFLRQFDNVVPVWGIQREAELDEFLDLEKNPPKLDEAMWSVINRDRRELAGNFCRGCGYCMPCPAGINIRLAARISLLLRRSRYNKFMEEEFKEKMELINNCKECGNCKSHCPYQLDTPELLKRQLEDYLEFYSNYKKGNN